LLEGLAAAAAPAAAPAVASSSAAAVAVASAAAPAADVVPILTPPGGLPSGFVPDMVVLWVGWYMDEQDASPCVL
jgi:hypothetical protein